MPERPIIAVDAAPAVRTAITGTERFTREVIRRLPAVAPDLEWRFYAPHQGDLGVPVTAVPPGRLWTQVKLRRKLARDRPDLFVALGHVVPDFLPVPAYKVFHDLAFERFPEAYPASARFYLRHTERSAARRCVRMAAVSETTRKDLVELYGVPEDRVDVVHEGGGERRPAAPPIETSRLAELGLSGQFALHVGRVEPRKNQASAAVAAATAGLELACVGALHDRALAARLRKVPGCHLLGAVSDGDRDLLYRSAVALVFPSLYEGFGLPVIEAMSFGLPVIIPRNSSLPEIGGNAALYVGSALDVPGMAGWLRRLQEDDALRRRCAEEGRARAALFTWDRCTADLAASIRTALSARAPRTSAAPPAPR